MSVIDLTPTIHNSLRFRFRINQLDGTATLFYAVEQQRANKDMTAPLFYRSAAWIFLMTVVALLILNLLLATIGAEKLNSLLDNLPTRVLLGALGVTGAFGGAALWIGMMWNCLTHSNTPLGSKIRWFLLIVFTNLLGALIYYFKVYRREGVESKGTLHEVRN